MFQQFFYDKIYIIIGENGSGKSTFIKTILGTLKPTSGNIIMRKPNHSPASVGFCPQHDILVKNLTVEEHITFYYLIKTGKDSDCWASDANKYFYFN